MEFALFLQIFILIIIIYLSIFSIVDRICKCKESISTAGAFAEYLKDNKDLKELLNEK